jgi:phage FluMu protein Com
MFKTSHLQELKRRYKEMYASPEEGTNELVDQYKKETPGQSEEIEEDTDKDKPGTQGDQAEYQRKRKEIAKKFGVESCSALKDEKERKACYAALDAAHVSDDEESEDDDPVGKNEEVKVDEAKKPTRTTGMECMECGKKFRAKLSTLQYGRTKCPKCKSTDLDFAYGESVEEEVEIAEAEKLWPPTVETLRAIVDGKSAGKVKFKDGKALVDTFSASAMIQVYDALKRPELKKTFEKMLQTTAGYKKSMAFAFSLTK